MESPVDKGGPARTAARGAADASVRNDWWTKIAGEAPLANQPWHSDHQGCRTLLCEDPNMATASALLFPWSEAYSVKVGIIDTQHKKLVDLINELHQAMI